ncbi:MAG: VWA domain-containing protein, partial [Bacteroidales bacterium]|nr:VWA domain-containing protein [Bacteroidales bacterium]
RLNAPYVKVFEEERELTVMLLVDVSGSRLFGTKSKSKKDLITEISAVLSFSASANNDKVGALFFSSKVEKFIPPKKGRSHLLRIIRELLEFEPQESGTDVGEALRYLTNAIKRRCTAFLISDLIDFDNELNPRWHEALKIAVNRHELSVVSVYDPRERELPDIGLVNLKDAESGEEMWVDTSSKKVRDYFNSWNSKASAVIKSTLMRYGVDRVQIPTDGDFVKGLVTLFKNR